MTELKILMGQIIRGNYEQLKEGLETKLPPHTKLFLEDEPYCTIQGKAAIRAFKLVINHPQFVFDDLFIARQLYFSAPASRNVVLKHPKFLKVLNAKPQFMDYFYERYGPNAGMTTHVGMVQRYIQAENAIRCWKKEQQWRLLFNLYPALVKYSRNFKERYYAPGGPGYLKAFQEFSDLAQVNNCFTVSA